MKLYKNIFFGWLNKDKMENNNKKKIIEEYFRNKNYNITIMEDRILIRERNKFNLYCSTKDEQEFKDYKELYENIIKNYVGKEESTSEYIDVEQITKYDLLKRVIDLERKINILINNYEINENKDKK
jgi:hypothetical protein